MTMDALYKPQRTGVAPGRAQPRPQPGPVGRPRGAHRIIKPLGLAPISGGSDTPGLRVNWPENGRVLAFTGFAFDPDGEAPLTEVSARVQIQIQIEGVTHIFSNGESSDWASLYALTPAHAPWFELDLPVHVGQPWLISLRNLGTGTAVPEVLFSFRRGS
jgi:hypothetical protein